MTPSIFSRGLCVRRKSVHRGVGDTAKLGLCCVALEAGVSRMPSVAVAVAVRYDLHQQRTDDEFSKDLDLDRINCSCGRHVVSDFLDWTSMNMSVGKTAMNASMGPNFDTSAAGPNDHAITRQFSI